MSQVRLAISAARRPALAASNGMLEASKRHWRQSGRPIDQLRFKTFGSSGRFASQPFKLKIPRLGLEIDVPANQTMLEALEAAGVEMIFDCRRGECGLCALPILAVDGIVDHRDVFFSDEDKGSQCQTLHLRFAGTRDQHNRRYSRQGDHLVSLP
jgi:2Fe-2S iron-sulfur cluster binding domain